MNTNQKEKISIHDSLSIQSNGMGLLQTESASFSKVIGQINIHDGLTKKKLFTFNDVILPGSTFILEQMFKRRATFAQTTLSTDLSINAGSTPSQLNLKDEAIFGFVAGIGGTSLPDTINAVKFNDKTVSTIVPLRVVDTTADLSPTEQAKYAMKKTVGTKYYYYAKKFDADPVIKHLYSDGTEIPSNIDQIEPSLGMLVFSEQVFTIGTSDIREYFMLTYGSVDSCRVNSISLVAGFINNNEYAGVRCVTKANLPNLPLRNADSYYIFTYKVYVI